MMKVEKVMKKLLQLTAGPLSFSSAVPLLGYAAELFGLSSPKRQQHRRNHQLTAPNADIIISREAEDEHSLPPYGPPYNDDSIIAKQVWTYSYFYKMT